MRRSVIRLLAPVIAAGMILSPINAAAQSAANPIGVSNAAQIGVAAAVQGNVQIQSGNGSVGRVLESGRPIFLGEKVVTGPEGRLQILLLDQTVFTIGPNSAIVIDEFVYDPASHDGQLNARVIEGVFRFISGKIAKKNPENMNVHLPAGTIGIRGTIVTGEVSGMRSTVALRGPGPENRAGAVIGRIDVSNSVGDTQHTVRVTRPGFGTTVPGAGLPPTPPAALPPHILDSMDQRLAGPSPDQQGMNRPADAQPAARRADQKPDGEKRDQKSGERSQRGPRPDGNYREGDPPPPGTGPYAARTAPPPGAGPYPGPGYYDASGTFHPAPAAGYYDASGTFHPAPTAGYYDASGTYRPAPAGSYDPVTGAYLPAPGTGGYYDANGTYIAPTGSPTGTYTAPTGTYSTATGTYTAPTGTYTATGAYYPSGGYYDANGAYIAPTTSTTGTYTAPAGTYSTATGTYYTAPTSYTAPTGTYYPSGGYYDASGAYQPAPTTTYASGTYYTAPTYATNTYSPTGTYYPTTSTAYYYPSTSITTFDPATYINSTTYAAQDSATQTNGILDGFSSKTQLASVQTGRVSFMGGGPFVQSRMAGTATSIPGNLTTRVDIDFGSRTWGGGSSYVTVSSTANGGNISQTMLLPNTSFGSGSGDLAIYNRTEGSMTAIVEFLNRNGVIARDANVKVVYDNTSTGDYGHGGALNVPGTPTP